MKRFQVRTPTLSKPVIGALAVAIGLAIFTYWRNGRDTVDASQSASAPAKEAALAHARVPASSVEAPVAGGAASDQAAAGGRGPTQSKDSTEMVVNLFPAQSWLPPAPPPPPPPPPPKDPPPLPFTVRSLWLSQDGSFYVVLNGGGRELPVCAACRNKGFFRKGDVLLDNYRIDSVDRREMRFTFLPMKRKQQLSL